MTTHRHPFSIRLPGWQRWCTYLVLIAVAASGIAWSLFHDVLQLGWMLAERRLLVLHGVMAAATLVLVGGLMPLHIRLAWRVRRNQTTGVICVAAMSTLSLSGLMLYYGGEDWRDVIRWSHIGIGLATALAVPLHVWRGRRLAAIQADLAGERSPADSVRRFTA
ncbi:MAG: hypothetical protein EKK53_06265 [Burkholderiales bacterium]|nr:MAG: hypothetical protein EKK53_06265 [Burkholderiales bacterium]